MLSSENNGNRYFHNNRHVKTGSPIVSATESNQGPVFGKQPSRNGPRSQLGWW
jgi:hypothetical protein